MVKDKYIELRNRLDVIQKEYRKQGIEVQYMVDEFLKDFEEGKFKDLEIEEYKGVDFIAQYQGAIYKKGNSGDDVVFTPPYLAKFMSKLLNVNEEDVLIDLCVGTGTLMVADTTYKHFYGFDISQDLLDRANTNASLKGIGDKVTLTKMDGTGDISKVFGGNKPTKAIINPPYSYRDKGMPFVLNALDNMEKGGLCVVITQSSAGSGGAEETVTEILKRHKFIGSVEMDVGLFKPFAGVGTHVYLFKAGNPHNYGEESLFINVGENYYKRTARNMNKVGEPLERLQEIVEMFKEGKVEDELGVQATIKENGLNYTQYRVIDTKPTELDFLKTVVEYMEFEYNQRKMEIFKEYEEKEKAEKLKAEGM